MKKIGVYILVLVVISMLLFNGCTAKDTDIEQERAEGEELVCLPGDTEEKGDLAGKVTEEIKNEIPDVLDEEEPVEEEETEEEVVEEEPTEEKELESETTEDSQDVQDVIVKTYTEGDLVKLTPKATDKDDDEVTF